MKILHILHPGKSGINGVTNVVANLTLNQLKCGADVKITCIGNNNKFLEQYAHLSPIIIGDKKSFTQFIESFLPDLVVFHSLYYIDYIRFSKVLRTKGIPYSITFHGGASKDNFKKHKLKKTLANFLLFNKFIKHAVGVIYLNEGEKSKSIFTKINTNDYIIPNGISIQSIRTRLFTSNKIINIIFLSRIDIYGKGLDILYQVLQQLKTEGYEKLVRFKFYGFEYNKSGSIFKEFSDFAKYYGPIFGKDKIRTLEECDIMILPSRSEGMPLTILEGFACGLPAIVTPETNMGKIIEENNIGWVTQLTVENLKDTIKMAISQYAQNPLKYQEKCLQVASKFTWDRIAIQSLNIYKKMIGI